MKEPSYKLMLYSVRHLETKQKAYKTKMFIADDDYDKVLTKYYQLLENNGEVLFPKKVNFRGETIHHELAILSNTGEGLVKIKDEEAKIVRTVRRVNKDEYVIIKTSQYLIEEKFKHWNSGAMITFQELVKKFFVLFDGVRFVTILNNKIVIEHETMDLMDLLILKNVDDSYRISTLLYQYCNSVGLSNKVVFYEEPFGQEKYDYYDKISKRLGIKRSQLIKISTR